MNRITGVSFIALLSLITCLTCGQRSSNGAVTTAGPGAQAVQTGADQMDLVIAALRGKRIGLVANHTSQVNGTSLLDTLLTLQVDVLKIFTPEHGFRGNADAGQKIGNAVDSLTGLPIVSLYGDHRQPTAADLQDLDEVVFDIQDVGVRFYTYISTMQEVMNACAVNNKPFLVLDRPNPNAHYVDGPLLRPEFKSFVGMNPIPVVYGLTMGELARMINGEGWLAGGKKCALEVIPARNWKHSEPYSLPVGPSPNLPNDHAINLYPSVCLFEGTVMSVGRGTTFPFEVVGHPRLTAQPFTFTPQSMPGMATHPPYEGVACHGLDLRDAPRQERINLSYLINLYRAYPEKEKFFTAYIDKLAGTDVLKQQIAAGMREDEIRATWQDDLDAYREMSKKYRLYE